MQAFPVLIRMRGWKPDRNTAVRDGRLAVEQSAMLRMMRVRVMDALHASLLLTPEFLLLTVWRNDPATVRLELWPRLRGRIELGKVYLRYRSALGLVERLAVAELTQTIRVVPSPLTAGDESVYLIHARQAELERRRIRRVGIGREFESLREYQPGDEPRFISWTATARRSKLITCTFTTERSQQVWIVVDCAEPQSEPGRRRSGFRISIPGPSRG